MSRSCDPSGLPENLVARTSDRLATLPQDSPAGGVGAYLDIVSSDFVEVMKISAVAGSPKRRCRLWDGLSTKVAVPIARTVASVPMHTTVIGERINSQIEPERVVRVWIGAFSVVALLLAEVGLYGVVAQEAWNANASWRCALRWLHTARTGFSGDRRGRAHTLRAR